MMIGNALNGVYSDSDTLQIVTKQEAIVKTKDIHRIEKKIPAALVFLVMKIRKNIQFIYQKDVGNKNIFIYYY